MSHDRPEPSSKADYASSFLGPESLGGLGEDEVRSLAGVIERSVIPELVKAQERHYGRLGVKADPSEYEALLTEAYPKALKLFCNY